MIILEAVLTSSFLLAHCFLFLLTRATAPVAIGRDEGIVPLELLPSSSSTDAGGASLRAFFSTFFGAGFAAGDAMCPSPISTSSTSAPPLNPKSVDAQRLGSYGSNFGVGGNGGAWKRNGVLGPKR